MKVSVYPVAFGDCRRYSDTMNILYDKILFRILVFNSTAATA